MVEIVRQRTLFGVRPHQQRPQISQEVLDARQRRLTVVDSGYQRRIPWQVVNQDTEAARGDLAAPEVQQVESVEPGKVSLYRIAVLIEQGEEAG